ncbi:MAG: LysM peptidoglycan-binding domain-containing protein [Caldilineaceae bacterium]
MTIQIHVQPQLLAAQRAVMARLFHPAQIVQICIAICFVFSVNFFAGPHSSLHAQSPCPNPYTVQPGDYWTKIAEKCGVGYPELRAANAQLWSQRGTNLQPGDKLLIPAANGGGTPAGQVAVIAAVRDFYAALNRGLSQTGDLAPAYAYLSTQRQAAQSLAGFRNTYVGTRQVQINYIKLIEQRVAGARVGVILYTVDMEQGRLVNHQYDAIYPVVLEAGGWRIGKTEKYDEIGALSEGALAAWFSDDLLHGGGSSPITPTPTPIVLPPQPTGKGLVTYLDCPADVQQRKQFASVHNRLYPGAIAIVLPSVSKRLLYASENYTRLIGELPLNRQLFVLDGPRCVQGDGGNYYQRWQVKDLQSGLIGWTSEGGRDDDGQLRYWLSPQNLYQACPGYPSRIKMGDGVYTPWTVTLSLRRSPSSSPSVIVSTRLDPGKVVRVIGGPECADGWTFWLLEVGNSRYYASEGDPNNSNAGYWLVPLVNGAPTPGGNPTPTPPSVNSPVSAFLAYQDALNRRDFAVAYSLLSTYFRDSDLCKLKQLCDAQTFGNGFRGKEFVSASDIRNEHQGWNAAYWVFDATFHPAGIIATHQNTICMLLENGQWKVHGILVLGSKSCG